MTLKYIKKSLSLLYFSLKSIYLFFTQESYDFLSELINVVLNFIDDQSKQKQKNSLELEIIPLSKTFLLFTKQFLLEELNPFFKNNLIKEKLQVLQCEFNELSSYQNNLLVMSLEIQSDPSNSNQKLKSLGNLVQEIGRYAENKYKT